MAITLQAAKMLWGRAAARCSMPNCRIDLVLDETETDNPGLVGEMAHMVAESENGPRGVSPLTTEERDRYGNLILLCRNHHREIDAQPKIWPVERLQQIKQDHEAWVGQSLPGFDTQKQRDDEVFAAYIDQWTTRSHLREWKIWIGAIFAHGQLSLENDILDDLDALPGWILGRVWPDRYPTIRAALQNYARILRDFLNTFQEHATKPYADATFHQTTKFYQIDEWNEPLYRRLAKQFDYHVDLVQDLGLELTRAANHVCDEVRAHLMPSFMLEEGRLSVMSGPHMDMTWRERILQYSAEEKATVPPYPGLEEFLAKRIDRDWHYGDGPLVQD